MITLDQVKIILKEAPVGKDGTILPNKKDSKRDKELTKRNIQKYSKQTELKLGNAKTTNVPLSTKRTLKGRPLGSTTTKKPKVIQPTIGVNQAEVSKKAKEFTDKVNKVRTDKISDKIDKEVKKRIRQAGGSGDFSPTMPTDKRKKAQAKRDARIKALDTPDPFEIDTSKAAEQNAKKFGTPKPPRSLTRFDNREPFQDDDLGQRTGKTGDKLVNKPVELKGSDKKISKKAIPQKTRPTTTPAVSGTYSNIGKGRTDDVSKFVSQVKSKKGQTSSKKVTNSRGIGNRFRGPENQAAKDAAIKASRGDTSGGGYKPPSGGGRRGFGGFDDFGDSGPRDGSSSGSSGGGRGYSAKDLRSRFKRYKSSYYKPGRIAKRALKFAVKRPGLTTAAVVGTAIGLDYLRKKIFKPNQLDRNKDFKRVPILDKSGKAVTGDLKDTRLSTDMFKKMAPGGEYGTKGGGKSTYDFITKNPRYRAKVQKTVKQREFKIDKKTGYYSGDPYGILNKKS